MSVNEHIVEDIKSRCNIVDVIGQVVPLKKAGSNYKGICPFHNEKTPSFVVSETKQIFTCFGCSATGDVIEFVKRYYNLDFMEAVEKLAKEYGIEIEKSSSQGTDERNKLYEINRLAAQYFFKNVVDLGSPGYKYMIERGMKLETLKKFGIGYALDKWDGLYKHMTQLGIEPDMLLKLGLISKSNKGYYDKFRNRVMFPIINTRGKVIGFGGRIVGDGSPKYLNSPESSVFLKKNNLYGLNLTRQEISKENCAILVEGYMDVVSLYQNGVKNVSASLGTALTENQAKLLKRYTKNIVLSYDSDEAGKSAAMRGIEILHEQDCKAKVLHITNGKDPDEFVSRKGREAYLDLVRHSLSYADYKIFMLKQGVNLEETEERIEFVKAAVEILKKLSPAEQDIYIKKIAKETKISEGAIRREFTGNNNGGTISAYGTHRKKEENDDEITPMEKNLIKLILTDSRMYDAIKPYKYAFKSNSGENIFKNISEIYIEGEEIDINKLADGINEDSVKTLENIINNVFLGDKEQEILEDCIISLEIEKMQNRYHEIGKILDLADDKENKEKIRELMNEQIEIQKTIQQMKERG